MSRMSVKPGQSLKLRQWKWSLLTDRLKDKPWCHNIPLLMTNLQKAYKNVCHYYYSSSPLLHYFKYLVSNWLSVTLLTQTFKLLNQKIVRLENVLDCRKKNFYGDLHLFKKEWTIRIHFFIFFSIFSFFLLFISSFLLSQNSITNP